MFTRLFRKVGRLIGLAPSRVQAQVEAGEALIGRYENVFATLALGQADYEAFVAALDAPPKPNSKLRKLMQSKDPRQG